MNDENHNDIETAGEPVAEALQLIPSELRPEIAGEPADDPVAAAHGVKKFQVHFADPEVLHALDKAAATGAWFVTIHLIEDGKMRSFFKPSDRFDIMHPFTDEMGRQRPAVAAAAAAFVDDAQKRMAAVAEQARAGLAGLPDFGPKTFDDEKD